MPQYSEVNWDNAECLGLYTDLFYQVEEERNATAYQYINAVRTICSRCPIWKDCLAYGFQYENYGVWGGLTSVERKAFAEGSASPQTQRAIKSFSALGITHKMIKEAYEYSINERGLENQIAHYRENGTVSYRRPRK